MAPHSSTLAWKIPWMEEPGGLHAVHGVAKSWTRLSDFTFTFHFHALEKAMALHSSTLAWKIPWMEEPAGLQSTGSKRVRHNWATEHSTYIKPWLCCCMCAHYAKVIPNHKWFIHSFINNCLTCTYQVSLNLLGVKGTKMVIFNYFTRV